jgi:hypothetical protein
MTVKDVKQFIYYNMWLPTDGLLCYGEYQPSPRFNFSHGVIHHCASMSDHLIRQSCPMTTTDLYFILSILNHSIAIETLA